MSNCPNCNTDIMPESYPVRVDTNTLVEDKALQFSNFDGVKSAETTKNNTIELEIVQSAYETNNHFKNRRKFEEMPHIKVKDSKNGVVQVRFDTRQLTNIVTAFHCPECDHVWDSELGDLNWATPAI